MKLKVDASHSRSIEPGSIKISAEKQLRFHRHCIHWSVQCRQWKTKRSTTLQCNAVALIWVFHVVKTETQSLLWFNPRPRSRCSSWASLMVNMLVVTMTTEQYATHRWRRGLSI